MLLHIWNPIFPLIGVFRSSNLLLCHEMNTILDEIAIFMECSFRCERPHFLTNNTTYNVLHFFHFLQYFIAPYYYNCLKHVTERILLTFRAMLINALLI